MGWGLIIDNIKYTCLYNDNDFKKKSLEDNVYFTLRDIFLNAYDADTAIEVNEYNRQLTNDICYEDRTDTFEYTKILSDKKYLLELITFMDNFCEDWFVFKENKSKQKFIEYMKFDDWLSQFEGLKELLNQHYKNIK
jgi:hypothetical protein